MRDHIGEVNEMIESQATTLQIQSESKAIAELSDEDAYFRGAKWMQQQLKK